MIEIRNEAGKTEMWDTLFKLATLTLYPELASAARSVIIALGDDDMDAAAAALKRLRSELELLKT